MPERPGRDDLVTVEPDFQVPRVFSATVEHPDLSRSGAACEVVFEVVRGRPHVRELTIRAQNPDVPMSPAEVAGLKMSDIYDYALRLGLLQQSPILVDELLARDEGTRDNPIVLVVFTDRIRARNAADETAVLAVARKARRQPRITDDDLRRVLELHADKGIPGVMAELRDYKISERNARRLLARARREVQ